MFRLVLFLIVLNFFSQTDEENKKWFSLGMRNTLSGFSHDGFGLGTGGQFRIQMNKRLNTDWFADFISINVQDKVKSEYVHIGWSVLFYPFKNLIYPRLIQPYLAAGHCFDYNKKSVIRNLSNHKDRWGSAVQAGFGTHLNITKRTDITLMAQYMIHLTSEITFEESHPDEITFHSHRHSTLEGHLLITASVNYKLFGYGK